MWLSPENLSTIDGALAGEFQTCADEARVHDRSAREPREPPWRLPDAGARAERVRPDRVRRASAAIRRDERPAGSGQDTRSTFPASRRAVR